MSMKVRGTCLEGMGFRFVFSRTAHAECDVVIRHESTGSSQDKCPRSLERDFGHCKDPSTDNRASRLRKRLARKHFTVQFAPIPCNRSSGMLRANLGNASFPVLHVEDIGLDVIQCKRPNRTARTDVTPRSSPWAILGSKTLWVIRHSGAGVRGRRWSRRHIRAAAILPSPVASGTGWHFAGRCPTARRSPPG